VTAVRVIGVGDNAVDKYLEMGKMYPGGNTCNFTVYAKRAGFEASYLGWVNSGREGKLILDALKSEGVDTSRCRVVDGMNAYCDVKLVGADRVFLTFEGGVGKQIALNDDDLAYISQFELAHTTIYSFIEKDLPKLSRAAQTLSFDFSNDWTKEYLTEMLPHVNIAFLSYSKGSTQEVEDLLRWVSQQGVRVAVVTQGIKGATAFDGRQMYQQPIVPVKVVDTLGAGDAFAARFSTAYLSGDGVVTAMTHAAQMAADVCTYFSAWGYETTLDIK
jgi:fructoselysine 6-kinase